MTDILPSVVIIGRPNVGKSTLFNRLVGRRLALVDDQPGVTRDRREGEGRLFDLRFTIIDTAGLEEADPLSLAGRMRAQTEAAIGTAAAALMVIDARVGLTPLDRQFATWLRAHDRPVLLLANKTEGRKASAGLMEAYELGLGEPIAISAEHGEGMADLFAALRPVLEDSVIVPEFLPEPVSPTVDEAAILAALEAGELPVDVPEEPLGPLKLAVVGRPNAGKSTLINALVGQDRLVTGPEAGITRDSIAVPWEWRGQPVRLIDTAGMRKRARVVEKLEKLSVSDGLRAVDFSEVVVLLLDATLGLEAQDLRIADKVIKEGRALIIALNKWDTVNDPEALRRGVRTALDEGLAQVRGVPLITLSGLTGRGLDVLMQTAFDLRKRWNRRVPTAQLNRWLESALERNPPPAPGGLRIKIRYVTQVGSRPPKFVAFGSRLSDCPESYRRYLVNTLKSDLDLEGLPVRLNLRSSKNPFAPKK